MRVSLQAWAGAWWPRSSGSQEAEAAAWGLLGLAASPEEEGAGQGAGIGAGRGLGTGIGSARGHLAGGAGFAGAAAGQPGHLPPSGLGGGPRCASLTGVGSRNKLGLRTEGLGRQSRLGVLTRTKRWPYEVEGIRVPAPTAQRPPSPCYFCLLPCLCPVLAQA